MAVAATAMAVVRGLHLAATLSLLGTAGFSAWILPTASVVPAQFHRRLKGMAWISGMVSILAGVTWFVLQAAAIAGAETVFDVLNALPPVALHTRYGNILMTRLGLLLVATPLAAGSVGFMRTLISVTGGTGPQPPGTNASAWGGGFGLYSSIILTATAIGLQGMIGHAGATVGAIGAGLVVSEALHLAAAGIWLGALPPLWLSLRMLDLEPAISVCERFSPIGLACVLVLSGTGLAQGLTLIGGLPALFGTQYGHIALIKIALFLLALVLAALNRLWLTDRLAASGSHSRRNLLLSVGVETGIGLAIVMAAAVMASVVPAAHATPIWPFPWRFSLTIVNQVADLRREVASSLIIMGGALGLMIAAMLARRYRTLTISFVILAVVARGQSLELLTVEAYPTSFQTSPSGFSSASILHGQSLFGPNCAFCHGSSGKGDGPAADTQRIKPADLTMPHLWEHTDGEMFWWLSHGIADAEGGVAMPGFGNKLSADDLWALIDYVRAHNAGLMMQHEAPLDWPIPAPAFPVVCSGLAASSMDDLRGRVVYVVAGHAATGGSKQDQNPLPSDAPVVVLNLRDKGTISSGSCVATDPSAWQAYAILANLTSDNLEGAEFLVDPSGWLRAVNHSGSRDGWPAGDSISAVIRRICSTPIQQPNGDSHDHH